MARKKKDERTQQQRMDALLEAYAETAQIRFAARRAGIARSLHYKWLEKCPTYAAVFNKKKLAAAEYMESEAVKRATTGWKEPVYYQGSRVGYVNRPSDGLMMFLLRGMMPEKYGSKTEISGPAGEPMQAKIEVVFIKPNSEA